MRTLLILAMLMLSVAPRTHAADLRLNLDGTFAEPIPLLIVDTSGTAFIDQSILLPTPANATHTTATTGGTLAAATYYYRVAATIGGRTTLASAETSQVTTGSTSTVTVNWVAVAGATSYDVYCRTTGAQLKCVSTSALTWVDTGSVTPAGALPASNTTDVIDIDYTCGIAASPYSYQAQFSESGASLVQADSARRPGVYLFRPGANNVVGTNCPAPRALIIGGGGTDRDVVETMFGLADNFAGTAVIPGECTASGTVFDTSLPATFTATDAAKRIFLTWTSGALKHQTAMISAFNINGCVTVSGGYTAAPANADAFILVNK